MHNSIINMCDFFLFFLYLTSFTPFFLIFGINSNTHHKNKSVTFVSIIWFNLKYNQSFLASNECISIEFMH